MTDAAEAIYVSAGLTFGTIFVAGAVAIIHHDLAFVYILPVIWAGVVAIGLIALVPTGKR